MKPTSARKLPAQKFESGQTSVLLILMLGIFLMATMGFAVDLSNMWFHRQAAQGAADSACIAGAMDMLLKAGGGTPSKAGFSPGDGTTAGTNSDCKASNGAPLCSYAKFNGYDGLNGLTANTQSQSVAWTFVPSGTAIPGIPRPSFPASPFLTVTIQENVKTWFMGLLGRTFQQVGASCTCGLVNVKSAPPLLVLNPTLSGALSLSGNPSIKITGGPSLSIQVNSSNASAVSAGGSSSIDTSLAGPSGTGGDFGVFGNESQPGSVSVGSGQWRPQNLPIPDPFAGVPAPTKPAAGVGPTAVAYKHNGCSDSGGCDEYTAGYYASGIGVKGGTAILDPGIYYLDGDLSLQSNSTIRNAYVGQNTTPLTVQTGGVMLFMHNGSSISVSANSGKKGIDPVPTSLLVCSSTAVVPAALPATVNGNVLYGQCVSDGTYVGPPSSATISSTGSRGLLVFQAHDNLTGSMDFSGGGQFVMSGNFYVHQSDYNGSLSLGGNSGSGTYAVGEIVADTVSGHGTPDINMVLSSLKSLNVLKVSIFK